MKKILNKLFLVTALIISILISCNSKENKTGDDFMIGADISVLKKVEDYGGTYTWRGEEREALEIFTENGYNYARLRLFHTPNMRGPVCNSLEYTIELSKQVKAAGMKLMLNFHYSDTWADPQKQFKPKAWEGLPFNILTDSVYQYSFDVIKAMGAAGVLPDIVQVGNEITPGMIWPDGLIHKEDGEDWESFTTLLKAGIKGVREAYGENEVPVMIHIDKGGDLDATAYFFHKIEGYGVEYEQIGLSYYPWWHGTFDELEKNLEWLSKNKEQDIVLVETAYYANGYYPEPGGWIVDVQPFPPTEQGQYDFLVKMHEIARKYPKVKGLFYWEPEGILAEGSELYYLGRSLFDKEGNALKGIEAFR